MSPFKLKCIPVCSNAPKFLQLKKPAETAKKLIIFGYFGLVFSTSEISVHQTGMTGRNGKQKWIFGRLKPKIRCFRPFQPSIFGWQYFSVPLQTGCSSVEQMMFS